ncbi:sugar phosphate isomerase/epimerase [Spirosoma foliorum]|uniref:Sugar phosphate isomerase/epimerase n=1 Tax=Spirosoma foliorum TaxID=2710596 RepID=A0A7G5H127_9BACT|nr:sugar phosphate isomerase/epimerase [Spirosoma foliorum]QMW04819.1 sugar phosphate isomerase/epimerase [Spirosoma foliorum]
MDIKILSPQWGHEHLPVDDFIDKIVEAGYDGVDTWLPADRKTKRTFLNSLEKKGLVFVAHQHEATGNTFTEFQASFKTNLNACAEAYPVLINSHTGRDYFTPEQNLILIDIAAEISDITNIPIVHETHRGRMGYSPQSTDYLFSKRPEMEITADFSHWVCVTESMLTHFKPIVNEAISRTRHVHARVGFEQGPQVTDPRDPVWAYALNQFLAWWDAIVEVNTHKQRDVLTFTTEFGPFPYMPQVPFTSKPVASQFDINCFMKKLISNRYITARTT